MAEEKKKRKLFDIIAHIIVGNWIGAVINNPQYRWGGIVLAVFYLAYQIVSVWSKGDEGYLEIKETTIGIAMLLIVLRLWNWIMSAPRKVKPKPKK